MKTTTEITFATVKTATMSLIIIIKIIIIAFLTLDKRVRHWVWLNNGKYNNNYYHIYITYNNDNDHITNDNNDIAIDNYINNNHNSKNNNDIDDYNIDDTILITII